MSSWDDDEWDETEVKKPAPKKDYSEDEDEEEEAPKPVEKEQKAPPAKQDEEPKKEEKAPAKKEDTAPTGRPGPEQKVVVKNSFEELEILLQQHIDALVKLVVPKLQTATAKRAPAKFVTDAVRQLQGKLSLQESEQVLKLVKDMHTKQKKIELEQKKRELELEEQKKKEEEALLPQQDIADEDFFKDLM